MPLHEQTFKYQNSLVPPHSFGPNSCLNCSLWSHPEIGLEWHYNEAHHGKEPMGGIGDTVKNIVFRKVLSDEVVIGSPEEFTQYANQICQVDSLYLPTAEIPDEPEYV